MIELHGEIDIASAMAGPGRLAPAAAVSASAVVIDLRPATFFDCSGLRLLLWARRHVRSRSGQLRVVCDDERILRLLRVTGTAALLRPVAMLTDALAC
ncbi:STAS domain-containing protein [Streptomyces chrestomyceticus]|uniref:STAS domain-containing protein n=1 Tax=Streptomyces chrestomyceticus TaxID=68185 RepID=UPI0037ADBBA0